MNEAIPLVATIEVVPESVPLAGLVPIARSMEALEVVTGLPLASWTVTTGAKDVPAVVEEGEVLNTSFEADPALMLKLLVVAAVNPELVAWSV